MEKSENEKTDGNKKEYRPRLSSDGKAILKMQHLIVIIHKKGNLTVARLSGGGWLHCKDPLKNFELWVNPDLMMMTDCGFIVGFAFIDEVFPIGERSKLKMCNKMWANVTKNRNSDFKSRYERYMKNNNLTDKIST